MVRVLVLSGTDFWGNQNILPNSYFNENIMLYSHFTQYDSNILLHWIETLYWNRYRIEVDYIVICVVDGLL